MEELNSDTYKSPANIELVEIKVQNEEPGNQEDPQETDEFDFPLFSFAPIEDNNESSNGDKEEGNMSGAGKLMRISLKEVQYTVPEQKRPKDYYYAAFSDGDRRKFSASAVGYDEATREASLGPFQGWARWRGAVIDLDKHNDEVERLLRRQKQLQKRRPGQKQRAARRIGKQREQERQEKAREIKKMIKKKFHKRGGKKNKKKAEQVVPKFRTE